MRDPAAPSEATPDQLRFACATAVSLIQPYAPHIACELWERLGGERLWDAPWPVADPAMLVSDTGDLRGAGERQAARRGRGAVDAAEADVLAQARAVPNVAAHLDGETVVKEIVVPGRLVNLVAR